MLKFLNLQPEIFGIDINDLSLRIVMLKKKHKNFKVIAFNEVSLPGGIIKEGIIQDQEALVKLIKSSCNSVKGKKLATKHMVASLPEEKSFTQVIQVPQMSPEDLAAAVPYEVENYIPLTLDKVYFDFQVIHPHLQKNPQEKKDQKKEQDHLDLLINVMPKSVVNSYISCFKKAGLIPNVLEVESQAIIRALLKNGESEQSILIIDFGISNTNFIIYSGNSIRFTSSIPVSNQQLTQAIADHLRIDFTKAEQLKIRYGLVPEGSEQHEISLAMSPVLLELINQVRKYITFYHDHVSAEYIEKDGVIEKIILSGGGANLKNLPELIHQELNIPVEVGNPFTNISNPADINPELKKKALSFVTVLGLAIRGANESFKIQS